MHFGVAYFGNMRPTEPVPFASEVADLSGACKGGSRCCIPGLEMSCYRTHNFDGGKWLFQVIDGAQLHGLQVASDIMMTGQNDNRAVAICYYRLFQHHAPLEVGPTLIDEDAIEFRTFQQLCPFEKIPAGSHVKPAVVQDSPIVITVQWVFIHQQDS